MEILYTSGIENTHIRSVKFENNDNLFFNKMILSGELGVKK